MKSLAFLLSIFVLFSSHAATDELLTVGDPAPPLPANATWVRGPAVKNLERGKIYVIEFWSTLCGPCIDAMPHLNELQARYSREIIVIGVAGAELGLDPVQTQASLIQFLERMNPPPNYPILFDPRETDHRSRSFKLWLDKSKETGIPCSFVVDRDGSIAFIGHPMSLDEPLAKIIGGTWDRKIAKEDHAQRIGYSVEFRRFRSSIETAIKDRKWEAASALANEATGKQIDGWSWLLSKHHEFLLSGRFDDAQSLAKAMLFSREELDPLLRFLLGDLESSWVTHYDSLFVSEVLSRAERLLRDSSLYDKATRAMIGVSFAKLHQKIGETATACSLLREVLPDLGGDILPTAHAYFAQWCVESSLSVKGVENCGDLVSGKTINKID